jgi:type II secretory pathway pseudopilin PulG
MLPRRNRKAINMAIKTPSKLGFTLVEIMIVIGIIGIIGILAAVAVPTFVRARVTSQINACINNMRQLDGAVRQWALEKGKADGAQAAMTDIAPYIKLDSNNQISACPSGGTYPLAAVNIIPSVTCSQSTLTGSPYVMQ